MPKPTAVYALVGDEPFLQLSRLRQIIAQFPADVQRIDIDGMRAELSDVLDELRSFAMFGGVDAGKLVVVRDADEFISRYREQLEDYVAKPSNSATLVLRLLSLPKNQRLYKIIAKIPGAIISCEPPKDWELPKWIMDRSKSEHKLTVSQDAAQILAERIGAQLGRLDGELAKLALASGSGKISAEDVMHGVTFPREQEMWELTGELSKGDIAAAVRRWRNLVELDPATEFRAVTWLTMWIEEMRLALAGRTAGIAWKYRDKHPLLIKSAEKLGNSGLARAVDQLADVDKRIKSGLGPAKDNVERFILSLAPT
jgi:DNA polymerase-3 subunit delta